VPQALGDVAPRTVEDDPVAQLLQIVAPEAVWYWPARHAMHADNSVAAPYSYWPAAHSTQLDPPVLDAALPAEHPTHAEAAEVEE
jgi:hypothetical protein